jgi:cytoskeletal protein RodZ
MKAGSPTLAEIAIRTKICTRYLRAIEEGRFEELPGGIYGRSYIRQYAAAVGRDPDALLAGYARRESEAEILVPHRPNLGDRIRSACLALFDGPLMVRLCAKGRL